jgi:hypothetical protein
MFCIHMFLCQQRSPSHSFNYGDSPHQSDREDNDGRRTSLIEMSNVTALSDGQPASHTKDSPTPKSKPKSSGCCGCCIS